MKPLRMVMLIERYAPLVGGSETQCRLIAETLVRHGVEVMIVTRRIQPVTPAYQVLNGVQIHRLSPSGVGRIWKELEFAIRAAGWLWRNAGSYDLVHAHSATSITGLIVMPVLGWLKKPRLVKVATAGDLTKRRIETATGESRPARLHRLINRLINARLRNIEGWLAISHEIETELQTAGIPASRIIYLPNAVDTQRFRPTEDAEKKRLRAQLSVPSGPMVLFSGRLIHRKGIGVLLRAWPYVATTIPAARLVLLGSGQTSLDTIESSLQATIRQAGLESSILLVGERDATWEYLACADVFVFPSRREGLSNALLEAMSTGCAVVASAIGGTIDVLTDGQTGWLYPVDDHRQLAECLLAALQQPAEAKRRGQAARQVMIDQYDIQKLWTRYLTIYQALLHA